MIVFTPLSDKVWKMVMIIFMILMIYRDGDDHYDFLKCYSPTELSLNERI